MVDDTTSNNIANKKEVMYDLSIGRFTFVLDTLQRSKAIHIPTPNVWQFERHCKHY